MSNSRSRHTSHTPHPLGRDRARSSRTRRRWPRLVDSGRGKLPHKPGLPPCGLRPAMPAFQTCGPARMEISAAPAPRAVPDGAPPPAGWRGRRWFRGHNSRAVDRTTQCGADRGIGPPTQSQLQENRTVHPSGFRPGKGNRRHHPRLPARGDPSICPESLGLQEPRLRSAAIRPVPSRPRRRERRIKYRRLGRPARSSPSGLRNRHQRSRSLFWRPS